MTAKKKGLPKEKPEITCESNGGEKQQKEEKSVPDFPVVGIGASAGGLAAFEAFFSGMPVDKEPGMAFVLVQHLAPDHKSILTELIQKYTLMQVFEVEDGMEVKANCAYIIPPNRDMAFLKGTLQLLEPSAPRGQRLPIDFFFRSLAQDQRERAIGIILSGTGSDGMLGVRAIKGEGGLIMSQNPESTEYDGMPRSAISTGLVDFELPPAEMPDQLISYVSHAFGTLPRVVSDKAKETEDSLKKIFVSLRSQTGHDFSQYKLNTIRRRIERRMAIHQIESLDRYVKYLHQDASEVETLFHDMLIGVTNFFRDPEAFKKLEEQIIPKLFAGRQDGDVIRIWLPGCATGEEAYSIAIILNEHLKLLQKSFKVLIFATDIDSRAIATARSGIYPASIAVDIAPERLALFFTAESDSSTYRIHKEIRDMIVFSEQDIIKDPPFSNLDLISCRNLLIYMDANLQKNILPLFHYALNPNGFLFLGSSETIGEFGDLFAVLDRKYKLYQRKLDIHGVHRESYNNFLVPSTATDLAISRVTANPARTKKLSLSGITEQTLLQHIPHAAMLVNAKGDILYIHGRTGLYLEPTSGEAGVANALKMAREGLRNQLSVALRKAVSGSETVQCSGVRVKTNGNFTTVNLTIKPLVSRNKSVEKVPDSPAEETLYIVILEQVPGSDKDYHQINSSENIISISELADKTTEENLVALRQELQAKEEYLQTTIEELETTNEELKSSNEEMQSVNEELQSTNEELETSKEELQSVNEELSTVNSELQGKIADLTRANNDMNNLLSGTGIGTVFLDRSLRILRFTPAVTNIINLIQSDIGRPVGHIVSNLMGYDSLESDIQDVLDTLIPKELDVWTKTGTCYTMRILPYRTLDNLIDGIVINFVDITETKKLEAELRESEIRQHLAQEAANAGTWEWFPQTDEVKWSEELFRLYEQKPSNCRLSLETWLKNIHPDDHEEISQIFKEKALNGLELNADYRSLNDAGEERWMMVRGKPFLDENGNISHYSGVAIDITERRKTEIALQKAFDEIHTLRGIVPICANCKKIRDDQGFWSQVEEYVSKHSDAQFSHGICPECMEQLYPNHVQKDIDKKNR